MPEEGARGKEVNSVELTIRGSPEEMAALILAVQGRPSEPLVDATAEELVKRIRETLESKRR